MRNCPATGKECTISPQCGNWIGCQYEDLPEATPKGTPVLAAELIRADSIKQAHALIAIIAERRHQDQKYGPHTVELSYMKTGGIGPQTEQGPGGHELGAWLIVIEKELDEAKDALVHGGSKTLKGRNSIRSELAQIAAVCVAALEQHGVEES